MMIIYILLFISNVQYFELIMWTLEDIKGNPPESGKSSSVTWKH